MAAVDITADPRFVRGVSLFNDGEYLEASDLFEDLFFEGVRDEPDFLRHLSSVQCRDSSRPDRAMAAGRGAH